MSLSFHSSLPTHSSSKHYDRSTISTRKMMPPEQLQPKWHRLPVRNVSMPAETSKKKGSNDDERETSSVPQPTFAPVTVAPADSISTTTYPPVSVYTGSGSILKGYCVTPDYTILDGPTVYWVPVVGCISSRQDCCASETGSEASKTSGGAGAAFPISSFPAQAELDTCPQDYHTVGGTGCCPSSYEVWSTDFGGQTPCYSSLAAAITPPPIPDTLANAKTGSSTSSKPTSAIVNIAYALQYPVARNKPVLQKKAKIGVGVGTAGAAIIIGVLIYMLVRKFRSHRKVKDDLREGSVQRRFGSGVDMSRAGVGTEEQSVLPPPMSKTFGGARYAGVPMEPAR
ncbi:hypothetical protein K469DRAFT_684172 [Zopfia rhizophila CBS 207.26]|uniref:Uncharacterized protein n=1 Tax=Zopfia rhizophila CBS 207.26 TaxID=1314779 RepID=A0A6A6EAP3_9PEZI|nr:hypothetical protein K469DRAFT_684172 [Zopfia rhizophila CBS 207.26]